jgi:hypothetical protein
MRAPRETIAGACTRTLALATLLATPSCTTTTGPFEDAGVDLDAALGVDARDANACGSGASSSGVPTIDLDAGADAGVGCAPLESFPVCVVPSGSTVLVDGAVLAPDGGPGGEVCTNACGSGEYAQACSGTSPDPALQCTVIAIPTPAAFTYYCCACPGTSP